MAIDYEKEIEELNEAWRLKIKDEVLKRKEFEELYYEYRALYEEQKKINVSGNHRKAYLSSEFDPRTGNKFLLAINKAIGRITRVILRQNNEEFWQPVFDADFYSKKYSDVTELYGDDKDKLFSHFINFGIYEGRVGNSDFNVLEYVRKNSDLRTAYKYNLPRYYTHYIKHGKDEERICK